MSISRKFKLLSAAALLFLVQACSGEQVMDNTMETGMFVGRTAVKTTVGAGKLAYKGTSAAVRKARETE